MEKIVEFIVKELVANKDAVSVTSIEEGDNNITIKVTVADEDMGKVIGKGGKIASAIRAIIRSASSNTGKKYFVKIGEREE
ncbi:MAG: KH domain-containing protein [Spirochaetales bacterium]